jgi:hypothetical protein
MKRNEIADLRAIIRHALWCVQGARQNAEVQKDANAIIAIANKIINAQKVSQ